MPDYFLYFVSTFDGTLKMSCFLEEKSFMLPFSRFKPSHC